jgi:hypothetical protein
MDRARLYRTRLTNQVAVGDGGWGAWPPNPHHPSTAMRASVQRNGLGARLRGALPPMPVRWVGCIATQPKQSDAKAKQCLGVALLCNAEGGGGRALLRNATSGPYPREACPREAYGMQGLCIVLITGLRNQPFVVHEYFS